MERDLDIATGQVQYHLRRLVNDEVLVVDRINSRVEQTHCFDLWERHPLVFLRR